MVFDSVLGVVFNSGHKIEVLEADFEHKYDVFDNFSPPRDPGFLKYPDGHLLYEGGIELIPEFKVFDEDSPSNSEMTVFLRIKIDESV